MDRQTYNLLYNVHKTLFEFGDQMCSSGSCSLDNSDHFAFLDNQLNDLNSQQTNLDNQIKDLNDDVMRAQVRERDPAYIHDNIMYPPKYVETIQKYQIYEPVKDPVYEPDNFKIPVPVMGQRLVSGIKIPNSIKY